jgi:hypothetical protein
VLNIVRTKRKKSPPPKKEKNKNVLLFLIKKTEAKNLVALSLLIIWLIFFSFLQTKDLCWPVPVHISNNNHACVSRVTVLKQHNSLDSDSKNVERRLIVSFQISHFEAMKQHSLLTLNIFPSMQ